MAKNLSTFAVWLVGLIVVTSTAGSALADGIRPARSHKNPAEYTDRLIVRLKDEPATEKRQAMAASRARSLSAVAGAPLAPVRAAGGETQVVRLMQAMPVAEVEKIAARLAQDPDVLYAQPDRRKFPHRVPNDPRYGQQWYLFESVGGINAPAAWDITTGSPLVVVAVVDGGVVLSNTELQGRIPPNWGYDFIGSDDGISSGPNPRPFPDTGTLFLTANDGNGRDSDPSDPGDWIDATDKTKPVFTGPDCIIDDSTWHGTHVTGIIGANSDNGAGMAGLDWSARILPVRVLGKCGGYTADIVDGARWAAGISVPGAPPNANPANVINMSLGGRSQCSPFEQAAINDILARPNVKAIVTSAGNESEDASLNSPGNCNGVINVAATDRSGNLASYSDFGAAITISAPGGFIGPPPDTGENAILSLYNRGTRVPVIGPTGDAFAFVSGTSAAAPQVSGVISLMLAVNPSLDPNTVRDFLTFTARPFIAGSNCTVSTCGAGILDAAGAVRSARDGDLATPSALAFATTQAGQNSSVVTVSVTNLGASSIVVGTVSSSSSEFAKITDGCSGATLTHATACDVQLRFQPTAAGSRSGTLSVPSTSMGGIRTIQLSGTATAPPPPPPPPSGGGGGGGGCTTGNGPADAGLALLTLMGLFGLARRKK